jgi:hypothetical protein
MRKGIVSNKGLISQIMKGNDRIIKGFNKLPEKNKSELNDLIKSVIDLNVRIITFYMENE